MIATAILLYGRFSSLSPSDYRTAPHRRKQIAASRLSSAHAVSFGSFACFVCQETGSGATAAMKKTDWAKRIQRAADLAERYPSSAEILAFYRHILEFQSTLRAGVSSSGSGDNVPFRDRLNLDSAARQLPALLTLTQQKGPEKLALEAADISRADVQQQREMLQSFLSATSADEPATNPFFARVLLQPYAEELAAATLLRPRPVGSTCPVCDRRPQVAVLRPEGDGGKRFLVCSFCASEWEFRRVLCPMCGEEDYQKLPRYSAEQIAAVRVEACDACKCYLKSVDLTVDGLAVPLVDEIASAPLDIWAMEHGFNKIVPNLMGL
jgi:FdhE protein